MKNGNLSQAESVVLETFRKEVEDYGKSQYQQALVDVSGILVWLTSKPRISTTKLAKYTLAEFEKAMVKGSCNPDSTIVKTIDFYKKNI